MKRGFMDVVATSIIPASPGETARWYAEEYLHDNKSDAKDPVQSLANTLDKQVREGKEPRIRRERIGGVYRYFPATKSAEPDSLHELITQIKLNSEDLENIDNLVAVQKFTNRNNAIKWLIIEGMKANRDYLNKVSETRRKIEQLKKEIDVGSGNK